jgi:hypothetical protein
VLYHAAAELAQRMEVGVTQAAGRPPGVGHRIWCVRAGLDPHRLVRHRVFDDAAGRGVEDDPVRLHHAGDDRLAQPPARLDERLVAAAGAGIGGEQDARRPFPSGIQVNVR